MNEIFINKLDIKLNLENIKNDFIILKINAEKNLKNNINSIDEYLQKYKNISSFYTKEYGYIMFLKNEKITLDEYSSKVSEINEYVLVNLLFASLNNYVSDFLRFSNTSGRIFLNLKKVANELVGLELKISQNYDFSLNVVSFSKYQDLQKYFPENKLSLNVYNFKNDTLIRDFKKNKNSYMQKKLNSNTKNTIKFMVFDGLSNFQKSKVGVLYDVLVLAKQKLSKYLDFDIVKIENIKRFDVKNNNFLINLHESLKDGCEILNFTDNDELKTKLESYLNNMQINSKSSKNAIAIIKSKSEYEEDEDIYNTIRTHQNIQHICKSDFAKPDKLLYELVIKKNIDNLSLDFRTNLRADFYKKYDDLIIKLSLNDDKLSFSEEFFPMDMALCKSDCEGLINIDGKIFGIFKTPYFTLGDFYKIFNALNGVKNEFDTQEIFAKLHNIKDSKNAKDIDEFIAIHTGSKTIKNKDFDIKKSFVKKLNEMLDFTINPRLQQLHHQDSMFLANTNLNYFIYENNLYYFVGKLTDVFDKNSRQGLKPSIVNASPIRVVKCLNDDVLIEPEIYLKLLSVNFVRLNELSVLPFLFKYINEYSLRLKHEDSTKLKEPDF